MRSHWLPFAVLLAPTLAAAQRMPPVEVRVAPGESMQRAIDQVASGGRVVLTAGTYRDNVRIAGKQVTIVGAGSRDTSWRPDDRGRPAVELDDGGGGGLGGMTFIDAAIAVQGGPEDPDCTPDDVRRSSIRAAGDITLSDVSVRGGGLAVSGHFRNVVAQGVEVSGTLGGGIYLVPSGNVTFLDSIVADTGAVGLFVCNLSGTGTVALVDDHWNQNGGPGLVVLGHARPLLVLGSSASENRGAGVVLVDVGTAWLVELTISFTKTTAQGEWGDGLAIWSSDDVSAQDLSVFTSARAGVSVFGCDPDDPTDLDLSGELLLYNNAISLDGETWAPSGSCSGAGWDLHDSTSSKECVVGYATVPCKVLSSGLMPPAPISD